MTRAIEHFGKNILDENGDVRPLADVDEGIVPPDDAFIIGRDYTLPKRRAHEHELEALAQLDAVRDKNPGVYVTLEQRYQDELDLLDIISGANMRKGFDHAKDYDPNIQERYGDNLPQVAAGAHANHKRLVNRDILDVYHANELEEAGVNYPAEIDFDARTKMRYQYDQQYGGPEHKSAREKRRKWLKAKLAELAAKNAA